MLCIYPVSAHAKKNKTKPEVENTYDPFEGGMQIINLPPSIAKCMTDTQCEHAAARLCKKGKTEWCEVKE